MICCHGFAVIFVVDFAVTLTTKVTQMRLDFRKTVFSSPLSVLYARTVA